MKHTRSILTSLLLLLCTTGLIFAEDDKFTERVTFDRVEASLLAGLESGNAGLMVSSANLLGELGSERAVNHLSKLLRESEDERVRQASALALIKINTERSLYVVKQSCRFNDNEKAQELCKFLYCAYQHGCSELSKIPIDTVKVQVVQK